MPGVIGKFDLGVPNEAGQRLTEFCQENILITTNPLFPTTPKPTLHMDITKCQYQNILCSRRWRSSIQSAKTRLGADCGSFLQNYEVLIVKFRHKLKKVGKTIRPFKYDLNQTLYDYTVEVMNRFKGLALVNRVPEKTMDRANIIQQSVTKIIPKEKKCKMAK